MEFYKPKRSIEVVFLHCSASDSPAHDNVETMRKWHLARKWNDVGYHYFIRKDGLIENGRDIEKIPAAQLGYNQGSIAICLHGLKPELFTEQQFNSLISLCRQINEAYENQIIFRGHCEVSNKACPVFDYRTVLGLDHFGEMTYASNPHFKESPARILHGTLKLTSLGAEVLVLQQRLNQTLQTALAEDGIFGQQTKSAVMAFQEKRGITIDGVVGPVTWQQLLST
ncbi:peptidoglycan-binding domain-containing protein [Photobacterium sp. DA100]|uniref:peptidoglycan recognition protein family protein n=1 Tax=Photobacterium sp. DA100 TaxID=3027472 RepID=UPI00247AB4E9|nr:peptidoglycan-binding domain-containing protein [Photobacterium sp. DA100]WEM43059.1 peptidoglycan-binding domain-containing protein [Photobacterium sp. DA100]